MLRVLSACGPSALARAGARARPYPGVGAARGLVPATFVPASGSGAGVGGGAFGCGAFSRRFCGLNAGSVASALSKAGTGITAVAMGTQRRGADNALKMPPSLTGGGGFWVVLTRTSSNESAARLKELVPAAMSKATRIPPHAKDALRAARRFAGQAPTYRDASKFLALQIEAFWQNNKRPIVAASLVVGSIVLWRLVFGVASTFVNLSETFAEAGFLALGVAMALFFLQYYRARSTISPDRMYQLAFNQLNGHAGVRELMGAPLLGTDVRAYIMSGGGVKLNLKKSFRPRWKRERAHLIFPLRGREKRGLVSVVAKRRHGQYQFKLIAVDVPAAAGGNTRIFLVGDQAEYDRAGVISELRDPLLNAMAGEPAFEEDDDRDEEEEASARRGAMQLWERAIEWIQGGRDWAKRLLSPSSPRGG